MTITYYELLGVQRTATLAEIKKAGRAKMMFIHPDKHQSDPVATHLSTMLTLAYDTLTDETKKEIYDLTLPAVDKASASDVDKAKKKQENFDKHAEQFSPAGAPLNQRYNKAAIWNISASRMFNFHKQQWAKAQATPHALLGMGFTVGGLIALFNMPAAMGMGTTILSAAVVGVGTAFGAGASRYVAPLAQTLAGTATNMLGRAYVVNAMSQSSPEKQRRVVSGFTIVGTSLATAITLFGIANEGYDLAKHAFVHSALGYEHQNKSNVYPHAAEWSHKGYKFVVSNFPKI